MALKPDWLRRHYFVTRLLNFRTGGARTVGEACVRNDVLLLSSLDFGYRVALDFSTFRFFDFDFSIFDFSTFRFLIFPTFRLFSGFVPLLSVTLLVAHRCSSLSDTTLTRRPLLLIRRSSIIGLCDKGKKIS